MSADFEAGAGDPRLDDLLLRWEELHEQGKSISAGDLCSTCPELADELARRIAMLRRLDPLLSDTKIASRPDPGPARAGGSSREFATAWAEFRELRFHAAGSLGEVFLAYNAELNREVALKFLRPSRARDAGSLRRFLQEAEVTGRLEHPGVVPIYALGADAAGATCYAMRFIRGETLQTSIDRFHAAEHPRRDPSERSLGLRELLDRFVSVCSTVGYAHSRGVLHRDLKPRNVMLGKYDETLVVDWGLAKPFKPDNACDEAGEEPVTPSSGDSNSETPTVGVVGTLAYMSPEQGAARRDLVGPASDVFSLGAILYAILTGQAPYGWQAGGEVLDKIKRCEFPPPRQIKPQVPRALEAICLKAMAREPAGRYATALDLADDVKRWLADQPLAAWREPPLLRARRWMRRHRTLVTSAAAVLVLGVVGLAAFASVVAGKNRELDRQRQRALAREALAIDAVKKFRDAVQENPELKDRHELDGLRKALLKEPLEFFRALRDQLQSDRDTRPEALARLAGANLDLARTTGEVGSADDAIRSCAESIAVLERLARQYPTVAAYDGDLAASLHAQGRFFFQTGQLAEALESWQRAATIFERLAAEHPAITHYQRDRANALHNVSLVLYQTGRPAEALESHNRILAIQERLTRDDPSNAENWKGLAASHHNIGNLLADEGQPAKARESYLRAIAIWKPLTRDHPLVPEFWTHLAGSQRSIADLPPQTVPPTEATARAREAMAIHERLVVDHPSVTEYQSALATSHHQIGVLLSDTGHPAEALKSFRQSLELRERLVAGNPTVPNQQSELATTSDNIGALLTSTGQVAEALELHRRALAIRERVANDNPRNPNYQGDLAETLRTIAEIEIGQQHWPEAHKLLERAIEKERTALTAMPHQPEYHRGLVKALLDFMKVFLGLDQPAQAIRVRRELMSLPREYPDDSYDVARALALTVAIALPEQRQTLAAEAVQTLRKAVVAGWKDAAETSRDPDLTVLRDREDFRRLVAELFDHGFPAQPLAR